MRYKQPYTLKKRIISRKTIYYYRVYDEKGNRLTFSTGQTSKTAAMAYCGELLKKGLLIPKKKNKMLFSEFVTNFWEFDSSTYIQGILARGGTFSQDFARSRQQSTEKHIIPYFGDKELEDITPQDIEKWLLGFKNKGLTNTTANQNLATLRIMLEEAVKGGYLESNPCDSIQPLKKTTKIRGILSIEEAQELLYPRNYSKYWDNKVSYVGNFLAAITGLRLGEIRALQRSDIHDIYISVKHSYDSHGLKDTKTHKGREVLIPPPMHQLLMEIAPEKGYIFSFDGGETPVKSTRLTDNLYMALEKMGIDEQQRKERNICFHSWRHFFNTTLRAGNISDAKIQAMTGHSTKEMTEHYTHFKASDFSDIMKIQQMIMSKKEVEIADGSRE